MKRILATALVMFLILPATPALAADDVEDLYKDGKIGVTLRTNETATVMRGETVWLALNWTAFNADFDNFEVKLKKAPKGVDVVYPGYPKAGKFTSLYDNSTLSEAELDYTAFQISVPTDFRDSSITFVVEAKFKAGKEKFTQKHKISVPLVSHQGADLQLVTTAASVPEDGWVGLSYAGMAPFLNDFSVEVNGVPVEYPAAGTSTSLWNDNVLQGHETDVAKFYVDPGMASGSHTLKVIASYTKAGKPYTMEGEVTLTIGGE